MSQGEIHPQVMNNIIGMTLGPEHLGRVRGAGSGATITSYFHQSRGRRSSAISDEVKRLVDVQVKKMLPALTEIVRNSTKGHLSLHHPIMSIMVFTLL